MGPDVRLEPVWKKSSRSSYRKGCDQRCKVGLIKKKLNPLRSNGKSYCAIHVGGTGILQLNVTTAGKT